MGAGERQNPFNQWRRTAAVSQLNLYDQFGREIGKGDGIILATPEQIIWVVRECKPVLDHKGPEHLCQLTLTALYQSPFQGGIPLAGIIKALDVSETGAGRPKAEVPPPTGNGGIVEP